MGEIDPWEWELAELPATFFPSLILNMLLFCHFGHHFSLIVVYFFTIIIKIDFNRMKQIKKLVILFPNLLIIFLLIYSPSLHSSQNGCARPPSTLEKLTLINCSSQQLFGEGLSELACTGHNFDFLSLCCCIQALPLFLFHNVESRTPALEFGGTLAVG